MTFNELAELKYRLEKEDLDCTLEIAAFDSNDRRIVADVNLTRRLTFSEASDKFQEIIQAARDNGHDGNDDFHAVVDGSEIIVALEFYAENPLNH